MTARLAIVLTALAMVYLAVMTALSHGQSCPATPPGYARQYRPDGAAANYPPTEDAACYIQGTNYTSNYISCYLCHDYMHRRSA